MHKSMMERFQEAKKYQKKALQALLPEGVAGHLEVIEQELTAIFMEGAKELTELICEGEAAKHKSQNSQEQNGKSTKKVTID